MLEFIEESHTYVKDGVILPSVSDILAFIFPDKYEGVPRTILDKKAGFGTTVHSAVEAYESVGWVPMPEMNFIEEEALNQYIKLKEKYRIEVVSQEVMVSFLNIYAGRYDMTANINGYNSLADIKTTATLDEEYLSWQLSFYELATGQTFEKLYAIWLPKKGLGKLVEIQRIDRQVLLDKLREYERIKQQEVIYE